MLHYFHARRIASLLLDHFGSLAVDSGHRTTFRDEHRYDQTGNTFSRENVMDHEWHLRMAKHKKVTAALAAIPDDERATLYHAFSVDGWPEPLRSVFFSTYTNACLAGAVMALPIVIETAKASHSRSPAAWLRRAIRTQRATPQLQYLLRRAELEVSIALEAFDDQWKEMKEGKPT